MITFPKSNSVGYKWTVNWGDFEEKINGRNVNINEVYAILNKIEGSNYIKELFKEITNKEVLTKLEEIKKNEKQNYDKIENGTALIIKNLRDSWDDNYVNKVFQTLELLNPPEGLNKINIWLFSGEYVDKYGLVDNEEFKDYDYKLVATYKKNNVDNIDYNVKIKIHRNEFDFNLIDKRSILS